MSYNNKKGLYFSNEIMEGYIVRQGRASEQRKLADKLQTIADEYLNTEIKTIRSKLCAVLHNETDKSITRSSE